MTGTAERCKEGSQAWSATRDTPGVTVQGAWHPGRGAGKDGYRCPGVSLAHSLNPWLISVHRSAVPL